MRKPRTACHIAETMLIPHDGAPLWVQHAWLCHGADADGANGEECPDGCGDDAAVDPDRLAAYQD